MYHAMHIIHLNLQAEISSVSTAEPLGIDPEAEQINVQEFNKTYSIGKCHMTEVC